MTADLRWWQKGIIYQIYPRSYQDSNGDGVGDLPGIIRRLDYVQSLHVDAVWLSPIYPSPMADFGYDVADYVGIDPLFGNMEDFDRLLAELHRRDLRLILDLVPNHTSDQHPWFRESRSNRDNPKRDWYIWADPAPDGGPPNNWLSYFGGSAWAYDEGTGQYYLHLFDKAQPDLNYRNPAVLDAMLAVMRFWLEKGVDGFRVDVIWLMHKDEQLRDEPPDPDWDGAMPVHRLQHIYTADLPEVHDLIRAMRREMDRYDERVMIGEIYLPLERLVTYYGAAAAECHLPFNFQLLLADWNAQSIRALVDRYESLLQGDQWPNYVLGNHDQHRLASRLGPAQARVAQMLLLTLRGTPTCYYGDEIGMQNVAVPPEKVRDPQAVNQPEVGGRLGRDPARSPMQWSAAPNAGFCPPEVEPWLPVGDDYEQRNAAAQAEAPASMLSLFRALAALRREEPALHGGSYDAVATTVADVFAFARRADDADDFLVVLNLGGRPCTLDLARVAPRGAIAVATGMERAGPVDLSALALAGDEGLVIRLP